jgi:hypothetical protein
MEPQKTADAKTDHNIAAAPTRWMAVEAPSGVRIVFDENGVRVEMPQSSEG